MKEGTVLNLLVSFFNRMDKNERAKEELKRFNKTIQFYVTDGKDVLVRVENGVASVIPGRDENPDLELWADTATYASLLKGKLSPGNAWWEQKTETSLGRPVKTLLSVVYPDDSLVLTGSEPARINTKIASKFIMGETKGLLNARIFL